VAVANGKKDVARTEKVVRVMFSPGTEVSGTGWRATVHPMGIRHVQRAMLLLAGSPQLAKTLAELKPDSAPADLASIAVQALPLLARDGLDLVAECTAFAEPEGASIESVPHWELPAIITAWVDVNFREERQWLPWVEAMEKLLPTPARGKVPISATQSTPSRPQATASETS